MIMLLAMDLAFAIIFMSWIENATGKKVNYTLGNRRPGDVVAVWADTEKVNQVLGWSAKRDLTTMMKDSWHWQENC